MSCNARYCHLITMLMNLPDRVVSRRQINISTMQMHPFVPYIITMLFFLVLQIIIQTNFKCSYVTKQVFNTYRFMYCKLVEY